MLKKHNILISKEIFEDAENLNALIYNREVFRL